MQRFKVCWNITAKCNQNCKYCHRFLNVKELDYVENEKILFNLINDGITHITWTGGEALLYPKVIELFKTAKKHNINNKLITNGIILANNSNMKEAYKYLDSLVLSIDSINDETNEILGRGLSHYGNIRKILEELNDTSIEINISTVVSKKNIEQIEELAIFLNGYNIDMWKLYKFIPLRKTAKENKRIFEISNTEFKNIVVINRKYNNIKNICIKSQEDLEKDILIIANGDIIKTENGIDIIKGNAQYDSVKQFFFY